MIEGLLAQFLRKGTYEPNGIVPLSFSVVIREKRHTRQRLLDMRHDEILIFRATVARRIKTITSRNTTRIKRGIRVWLIMRYVIGRTRIAPYGDGQVNCAIGRQ